MTTSTTTQDQHDEIDGVGTRPTSDCSFESAEHAALAYAKSGLSVIPLNPDKSPAVNTWAEFQSRIASEEEIKGWYKKGAHGVGIICGAISGNIECLDVDEKYNIDPTPLLEQITPIVDVNGSGLLSRLPHETSVNDGHHFVYRCSTITGSKKLARRPSTESELKVDPRQKSQVLIETKGEGGYFACYPSPGYRLVSGSFTSIPEISTEQRDNLLASAQALNRYTKEEKLFTGLPKKRIVSVVRPGDDFNLRGDISSVLRDAGWTYVYNRGMSEYWRRPGKREGISASFNSQPNMFYVFTSNADPLEQETWYTKFGLFTLLKYSGDYTAAAKDLAEQGYGETTVAAAESFLNHHFEFRFNEVTARVEFRKKGEQTFRVVQEFDLNSIYRQLRYSHIEISVTNLASVLGSEYAPLYNPFKEYYSSLPAWDIATDYIGQLAATVELKNPGDSDTFRTYLTKWIVGAVGTAIDPNVANHNCLTLVGPQGYYKTTWLNRLLPASLSSYLHVGTIDPTNKDTLIHLSECFLINLDELETLNKHELGSLKSIMTMKDNRIRRPYGHFADQLIRRASFVGSINKDSFLTDETGSRRFLVFEITSIDPNHSVDIDRVHAQAYHLFKSGYRHWFDRDEITTVNERNKQFSLQTTEDELVAQFCVGISSGREWLTATQVAKEISSLTSYGLNKSSARDFGTALKKAGYQRRKLNGVTRYAVRVISSLAFNPPSSAVKSGVGSGVLHSEDIDNQLF